MPKNSDGTAELCKFTLRLSHNPHGRLVVALSYLCSENIIVLDACAGSNQNLGVSSSSLLRVLPFLVGITGSGHKLDHLHFSVLEWNWLSTEADSRSLFKCN